MKIYTNDLVKGHTDFKVKCLTFGLYTQVSDSGPLGPLVYFYLLKKIRLDISCESSAYQRIHIKYQVLFLRETMQKYL